MAYNKNAIIETKEEFKEKRQRAEALSANKKEKLYARLPEIKNIDLRLSMASADIAIEIAKGGSDVAERILKLGEVNLALQKNRADILETNGIDPKYTEVKYECPICNDQGFVGVEMCKCFKKRVFEKTLEHSGIGKLCHTQSFETFDLTYYANSASSLKKMKEIFSYAKEYANNFTLNSKSLMFIGKTGLGKTHLSTSIAKSIIEQGFDVHYDTAQNILAAFEYERFGKSYNSGDDEKKTDIYFDCDLLIIDDLGTEITNQFTVSSFYNLINTRINQGKPILINTNLTGKEILNRYESRITSRLFGEFDILQFEGNDIRAEKLKR